MVDAIPAGSLKGAASDGTFQQVLRRELEARGITNRLGSPNWIAFAELLDGYQYETLRKALVGDRQPTPALMEAAAKALDLKPDIFLEYRVWEAKRQFDPREVGMAEALKNLEAWSKTKRR